MCSEVLRSFPLKAVTEVSFLEGSWELGQEAGKRRELAESRKPRLVKNPERNGELEQSVYPYMGSDG